MGGCISHSFPLYNTSCHNLALIDYCISGLGWADDPSLVQQLPSHEVPWWDLVGEENGIQPRNLGLCIRHKDRIGFTFSQFRRDARKEKWKGWSVTKGELWARLVMSISIHVLSSLTIHQSCVSHLLLHLGMTLWTSAHEKGCVSYLRKGPWHTFPVFSSFLHQPAEWSQHQVFRKGWSSNLLGPSAFWPSVWCKRDRNFNYIKLLKLGGCFYSS